MIVPYLIIISSLVVISVIILRKIPILVKLPPQPEQVFEKEPIKEKVANVLKEKVARPRFFLLLLSSIEWFLKKVRLFFLEIDSFFVSLIARLREKSHQWSEKSREWMSQRRMKKIERLKLIADLSRTPEEKEENLLRTLKQNPKDVKAYRELGFLYLEQDNFQDAKAAFEEVLKINPDDEIAKQELDKINKIENGTRSNQETSAIDDNE